MPAVVANGLMRRRRAQPPPQRWSFRAVVDGHLMLFVTGDLAHYELFKGTVSACRNPGSWHAWVELRRGVNISGDVYDGELVWVDPLRVSAVTEPLRA
jgi:hypothetical protein